MKKKIDPVGWGPDCIHRESNPELGHVPSYLSTLDEDSNIGMTSDDSVVIEGLDKSPCPPPMAKKLGLLGVPMLGARRNGASRPLQRAQTFAQVR